MNAIEVRQLGKKFRLRHARGQSLKATVIERVLRREIREDFWALQEIDFDVTQGETLGIIGPNGSGKTTLLSLLALTMVPTVGSLEVRGRVSSLLELGAGFHPDLTGRENIYLNASIMGIPRSVVEGKFDQIVDFSGLGHFIETPIKFYSSGMIVRLGFSVAVEADPDILLIDEVLSVGDAAFQKKSGQRIREFKEVGKTIVVVSHDMNLIRNFCRRVIHLEDGKIVNRGPTEKVIDDYIERVQTALIESGGYLGVPHQWGNREATIENVRLLNGRGEETKNFRMGDDLVAEITFRAEREIKEPVFGFSIHNAERTLCFGSNTQIEGYSIPSISGEGKIKLRLRSLPFQTGSYYFSLSIHSQDHLTNYHRQEFQYAFTVTSSHPGEGIVNLPVEWEI